MTDVLIDELLVFSDHHAHAFNYGAKEVLHNGVLHNSRLVESIGVIEQMRKYAEDHDIERIVFGGDLFHTREGVTTDAYNLTLDALSQLFYQRDAYLLVGNHDCFDREGKVHSLAGFKHWTEYDLRVVDSGLYLPVRGRRGDTYNFAFVPYTENRQLAIDTIKSHAAQKSDGPKILFAHLGMQGARVGSDYVLISDGDIGVDDVPYNDFAGCLFGHFHEHQPLFRNGWYIGATHQHTWGDVNTKRGFLHVRVYIDSIEFDFIETKAPKFIAVREVDIDKIDIQDKDFVKVLTEKKLSVTDSDEIKKRTKSANCEVIYVPPEVKLQAIELDEKHLTPLAMVETWVKANEPWLKENLPEVTESELIEYGRSILSKVQEKHD